MGSGFDGVAYITDSDGNPNVFNVERDEDGLWLNNNFAKPTNKWNPENKFLFRLRKYFLSALIGCGFSFPDYLSCPSSRQASCRSPPVLWRCLRIVCLR